MAMVINSNIMSLNAQRNLMISSGDQNQAMERLSSGKRINSAADDAAGLAIANRMTSQVRGLDQAIRNANDGISLIQTAEGALDETTNILQRMRELSIQSANGTYDDGNRATLNAEVQQLISEIDRISETTKFNGLQILDGTLGQVDLQAGADANETIALEIGATDSKSLGGLQFDVTGQALSDLDLTDSAVLDNGTNTIDVQINNQSLGDLTVVDIANDGINGLLDHINENVEGVEASALVEAKATVTGTGILSGSASLDLTVTRGDGTSATYIVQNTSNLQQLVDGINEVSQGEIVASVGQNSAGEDILVLGSEGATSVDAVISNGGGATLADVTGLQSATYNASLAFNDTNADNGTEVKISFVKNGTATDANVATAMAELGLQEMDASSVTGADIADGDTAAIAAGDLIINGVEIGAIADGTTDAVQIQNVVDAINLKSAETGVVAQVDTDGGTLDRVKLIGDDISIAFAEGSSGVGAATGLQERNSSKVAVGAVASINISTAAGAQSAIGTIDAALEEINTTRGDLGAINNRLDFTINNLSNVSENVAAARSRIEDADFAAESAALSRAQVLQQAGTAMLAQANAAPQQVLSLLQ